MEVLVAQSCLCDPMDYSLPGSSVHGILQQEYWSGKKKLLEWAAIPFSRDLLPDLKPRSPALQTDSLLSEPSLDTFLEVHLQSLLSCVA